MVTLPASANTDLAVLCDTVMEKTKENDVLFALWTDEKVRIKRLKDELVESNTFCVKKHLEKRISSPSSHNIDLHFSVRRQGLSVGLPTRPNRNLPRLSTIKVSATRPSIQGVDFGQQNP